MPKFCSGEGRLACVRVGEGVRVGMHVGDGGSGCKWVHVGVGVRGRAKGGARCWSSKWVRGDLRREVKAGKGQEEACKGAYGRKSRNAVPPRACYQPGDYLAVLQPQQSLC